MKMKIVIVIIIFVFIISSSRSSSNLGMSNEHDLVDSERVLLEKLFKNYDKKLKPSIAVEIKFALNLNQIITLIEQEEIIVLNVYIDHEWTDERLVWDPKDYNKITMLRISSDLIWSPDTLVDTIADDTSFLLPQKGTLLLVQHQGVVFWTVSKINLSYCFDTI